MPKTSLPPYQCPRCGYETSKSTNIRTHLYNKKKPCPGIKDTMELTDEIKEHILTHRIYQKTSAQQKAKVIINNYNQYNNINNIIAGMDAIDKLQHYMSFNGQSLIDFETTTTRTFQRDVDQLDNDARRGYLLDTDKLLEVVEKASKPLTQLKDPIRSHNVIFDNKLKELKIYDNGSWETMPFDRGTKEYMLCIQRNFLDSYERYLLRNINKLHEGQQKTEFKEMLEQYYMFIGCFKLDPFCKDADDDQILRPVSSSEDDEDGDDDDGVFASDKESDDDDDDDNYSRSSSRGRSPTTSLQWEYYPFYKRVIKSLSKAYINKMIRSVQDMLKRNSAKNVTELNRKITGLFHMDETFRDILLSIQN
jgi:hypothetical protein